MYQVYSNLSGVLGECKTYREYIQWIKEYMNCASDYADTTHNTSYSKVIVDWFYPDNIKETIIPIYLDQ